MPPQKYLWLVESKLGHWFGYVTKGRKGPQPEADGQMKFGKQNHGLDPNKLRTWKIPKGLKAGEYVRVQLWEQDTVAPADFLSKDKKVGDAVTGTMLQNISKVKKLQLSRQNQEMDKVVMMLAIALIIAVAVIGVMAYLVVNR